MLKLRKAQSVDSLALYEMRNHPETRKNSFSSDTIALDSHMEWFSASLNNSHRRIFIVEDEENIVGSVRFDMISSTEALVSITVAFTAWGKGVGTFALEEGEKMLKGEFEDLRVIKAKVKQDNSASLRLFSKLNYKPQVVEFQKEVL